MLVGNKHSPVGVPAGVDTRPGQKPRFFWSQLYPQRFTQCLTYSRCPIKVY